MAPQIIISAVTSKTQDELPIEESSALDSGPNYYSTSENSYSLSSPLPSNLPLEAPYSDPQSSPSYSPGGDPSIFPVPYPTAMFHKSLQKSQMSLSVVYTRLSYEPESSLLQL